MWYEGVRLKAEPKKKDYDGRYKSYDNFLIAKCLKKQVSEKCQDICKKEKGKCKKCQEACKPYHFTMTKGIEVWYYEDRAGDLMGQFGLVLIKNGKIKKRILLGMY
jgi:hypothetical protein